MKSTCLIDGVWLAADDTTTLDVTNPVDGDVIATVPNVSRAETQRAIDAASRAFEPWKAQLAEARESVLHRWLDQFGGARQSGTGRDGGASGID